MKKPLILVLVVGSLLLTQCIVPTVTAPPGTATPTGLVIAPISPGPLFTVTPAPATFAQYDLINGADGLTPGPDGDADFEVVSAGDPPVEVLHTGNGEALPAGDGNTTPDHYIRFNLDDGILFQANPTACVQIEVDYLDVGTDSFVLQYDQTDESFFNAGTVYKTDSGEFKTMTYSLCDVFFGNRAQNNDFRISDRSDGAEYIRRVSVRLRGEDADPQIISVDSCGANPFDNQPDSDAIQDCLNRTFSGDTVLFSSAAGAPNYRGYMIDKTLFLVYGAPKSGLTFTSTNSVDHALLSATADLKGFIAMLYARSNRIDQGAIDDIEISHLDLDGNRAERSCYDPDPTSDEIEGNWGSWLPECTVAGDAWCAPGGLSFNGAFDANDPYQDFENNPQFWSTGNHLFDLNISNIECGTALSFGGADSLLDHITIDTAGDHVHRQGCPVYDPDQETEAWSDGITFLGPEVTVTQNAIKDASDIGIVCFGGRDTVISNNTVWARPGYHGMFAGIALHSWWFGIVSGFQITGNQVINNGDETCGGIHVGINIGAHMWGNACRNPSGASSIGAPDTCNASSEPPGEVFCTGEDFCRLWSYVETGRTLTLANNTVSGAQINYLIEGLDMNTYDLIHVNNRSYTPRMTDWESDQGCQGGGIESFWGTHSFVAHDPPLYDWEDFPVYCAR